MQLKDLYNLLMALEGRKAWFVSRESGILTLVETRFRNFGQR